MLLFLLIASVSAGELISLGYKNYTIAKKEYQPIVIFYHGEDKASSRFLPDFVAIAKNEHSLQKTITFPANINFGLVDAVAEAKLMEKTQLGSTPQILLFFGDTQKVKYTGALNAQAFINWVKKTVRDSPQLNEFYPSSQIQKWPQFINKINSFQLVAILVTPEYRVAPLKAFVEAAKQVTQGYVYCHIFDPQIYQHLDVEREQSQLIIYSRYEDFEVHDEEAEKKWKTHLYRYQGDIKNAEEILRFLKIHNFKKGLVYVDDTKFQKLTRRSDLLPSVILLYNKSEPAHQTQVRNMHNARYALLNKAIVGLLNIENDASDRLDRWFDININTTTLPRMIALRPQSGDRFQKFKDGPLDPVEFYEQLISGQIKPFYRDQGILEKPYDGAGIYKLTRSTYYQFIKEQNGKGVDVVVMYTAKKCEPCRDFRPDYNEVFKKFKSKIENKVAFTRFDVELNEVDDLYIENYPHVKLYVAGKENPLTLHNERNERGLIKWLSQSSNYGELFQKSDL